MFHLRATSRGSQSSLAICNSTVINGKVFSNGEPYINPANSIFKDELDKYTKDQICHVCAHDALIRLNNIRARNGQAAYSRLNFKVD